MRVPIYSPLPPAHVLADSPKEDEAVSVIMAGLLIPGRGEPVKDGAVAIQGGKIDWVGPYHSLPSK